MNKRSGIKRCRSCLIATIDTDLPGEQANIGDGLDSC
jgi:hypothetical protein